MSSVSLQAVSGVTHYVRKQQLLQVEHFDRMNIYTPEVY